MNPLTALARSISRPLAARTSFAPLSMADWNDMFSLDGFGMLRTTMQPNREADFGGAFEELVRGAYGANGIVYACIAARVFLFSQARFQWQQMRNGQAGPTFGTPELAVLDRPEPGRITADLLSEAVLDADLAGHYFGLRQAKDRMVRLRPDWTTMIVGSPGSDASRWHPGSRILGFVYEPGGPGGTDDPITYLPSEIVHFAPMRDPLSRYSGFSWLIPIIREMQGDTAATAHKLAYFRNAATPNLSVKLPSSMTIEKAREWVALFEQEHRGITNAYRSMFFGGGAEAEVIGSNFQQMDFRGLQSGFETRIASASGMHPVIVPFSEGLTGSSLNAGNFQQAARLVADKTLHPLWQKMCGAVENVLTRPNGAARLWYDDDIPFLRTDVKDQADITQKYEQAITSYVIQGFTADSAVDAVVSADPTRLQHTGLLSVQLQPPTTTPPPPQPVPARTFTLSVERLRMMIEEGWRAATPADEEVVQTMVVGYRAHSASQSVRVLSDFWPTSGRYASFGAFQRDQVLPSDHPVVRAFPEMFEAAPTPLLTSSSVDIHCPGCGRFVGRSAADPASIGLEVQCRNCKRLVPLSAA